MQFLRRILPVLAMLAWPLTPAQAAGLLRDAGLEHALRIISQPILAAAGLSPYRTKIYVINDLRLNAYAANNRIIALNAGMILRVSTVEELQAVIAHEAAHITNGHLTRRGQNAQTAKLGSGIALALALAAGAASGEAGLGAGLALGSRYSAQGVLASHSREEESAADRSGMRFLALAGIDPLAMARVMRILEGQEAMAISGSIPYLRSHPLSRERVRAIEAYGEVISPQGTSAEDAQYWFERAQGKLSAYLRSPGYTFQRVKPGDSSDTARIERALAHYHQGATDKALAEIDALIAARPEDPFAQELRGWVLLEAGQARAALPAYKAAAQLAPKEPQILAGYGRALMAVGGAQNDALALEVLAKSRARDPYNPRMLRDLSLAYAKAKQPGMAALTTAERYALTGKPKDAALHARRAEGQLPTGSPGWAKAQDILRSAEQAAKK
ncbi:MAG: M48 family metalloprotease [Mangrovicoccus sp.]